VGRRIAAEANDTLGTGFWLFNVDLHISKVFVRDHTMTPYQRLVRIFHSFSGEGLWDVMIDSSKSAIRSVHWTLSGLAQVIHFSYT